MIPDGRHIGFFGHKSKILKVCNVKTDLHPGENDKYIYIKYTVRIITNVSMHMIWGDSLITF